MMSTLDFLLADEALGALDPARSLLVAALAGMRPEISADIARYEAAGGTLLATIRPMPLQPGGFERLTALIEAPRPEAEPEPEPAPGDPALAGIPAPLHASVAAALRGRAWRRRLPGVHALDLGAVLPRSRASRPVVAELVRVYPGWGIPRHGHDGEEITLVLAGGYTDETGRFGPGDIAIAGDALVHNPVADPGAPCLCYIVSDVSPRFTGPLGALTRALDRLAVRRA